VKSNVQAYSAIRAPGKAELVSASAPPKPKVAESRFPVAPKTPTIAPRPPVQAKAMFCLDCSSNKVMLAKNTSEPLPIASITKLLTAMIVIDEMNLDSVLEVPDDIKQVEKHVVGLRAGDLFTVRDLMHGMLIESGNDCAEVLARGYPKGGRAGFISAMNLRAARLGAARTSIYTPSGLDMKILLGRKEGRSLAARKPNMATAEEVAVIAREAFKYPLIREISSAKSYTMRTRNQPSRDYALASNDKLLHRNLPIAGAKTGFTGMAGKCIVALFKNEKSDYMVVVLNAPHHFKAAEKIYRWACKAL
jgi:D-alanyl-D-alanine carboxypeptidase